MKLAAFILFIFLDLVAYHATPIAIRTSSLLYLIPGGGFVALAVSHGSCTVGKPE